MSRISQRLSVRSAINFDYIPQESPNNIFLRSTVLPQIRRACLFIWCIMHSILNDLIVKIGHFLFSAQYASIFSTHQHNVIVVPTKYTTGEQALQNARAALDEWVQEQKKADGLFYFIMLRYQTAITYSFCM